jgi:hypothetical protein
VNHLKFSGKGGNLHLDGLEVDPARSVWSHDLTFEYNVFTTGGISTEGSNYGTNDHNLAGVSGVRNIQPASGRQY